MSSNDHSPVIKNRSVPGRLATPRSTRLPAEAQGRIMEVGLDVAADVCKAVINAANVTVEGKRLEQESAARWEATRRKISELDAEAAAEISKLKQSLEVEKETTKKLEIITNLIHRNPSLPKEIAEGLRSALDNLTMRS